MSAAVSNCRNRLHGGNQWVGPPGSDRGIGRAAIGVFLGDSGRSPAEVWPRNKFPFLGLGAPRASTLLQRHARFLRNRDLKPGQAPTRRILVGRSLDAVIFRDARNSSSLLPNNFETRLASADELRAYSSAKKSSARDTRGLSPGTAGGAHRQHQLLLMS